MRPSIPRCPSACKLVGNTHVHRCRKPHRHSGAHQCRSCRKAWMYAPPSPPPEVVAEAEAALARWLRRRSLVPVAVRKAVAP